MIIKLFDVQDGVLIPTEHCYSLKALKEVMVTFPNNYIKVYLYIHYMTYPDPEDNPFFNTIHDEKEELILQQIEADFSTDNPVITNAVSFCDKMYDTPTKRMRKGMHIMMDKIAKFFETSAVTTGRDGSLPAISQTYAKLDEIRQSFKNAEKDYNEEIKTIARGDSHVAYDQR